MESEELESLRLELRRQVPRDLRFLAPDLVQDALLRFVACRRSPEAVRFPLAFCHGILRRVILDYRRRSKVELAAQAELKHTKSLAGRDVMNGDVGERRHLASRLLGMRPGVRALQRLVIDAILEGRDLRHLARTRGVRVANVYRALGSLCRLFARQGRSDSRRE